MDFYSNFKVTASTTRSLQYVNKDRRNLPNLEEVIMLVGDCGKHPRRELPATRELYLSHALFPSRCSPRSFSDRDRNASMTPKTSKMKTTPTRNTDGNASLAFTNSTTTKAAATTTTTAASCPPKRSRRHTLHRRSRHVFVSSHSPSSSSSSSSSSSPAPCFSALPRSEIFLSTGCYHTPSNNTKNNSEKHIRRQHRRHNLALNAMDFSILLRGFIM